MGDEHQSMPGGHAERRLTRLTATAPMRGASRHHTATVGAGLLGLVLLATGASAEPLDQRIPGLFGGTLTTGISPNNLAGAQRLNFSDQFRSLAAGLAAARSQAPIPSASGAFRFAWDPDLDTFVRFRQSLGPGLAERAQTLGRHIAAFSVSYTHVDFDTQEGTPLDRLSFSQAAFSEAFLKTLGTSDQAKFGDDRLRTRLNLGLSFDLFFLSAAFGITDTLDASMALSVNHAHMQATAVTRIEKPDGQLGSGLFDVNSLGGINSPHVCDRGTFPIRCATDGFNDSAVGTGDLSLRMKWHFSDTEWVDLATAGVLTLPTGNASDFLGFHDPTFTPWLIASKTFDRVSPHLNLGYSFRSGADVSQAQWIAGADVRTTDWLTLAADFLGYHDDKRDGINDDVIQSAVGFKINPFGQFVIAGNFQFPLNRDGIRADVIYTGQIEYTY